MPIQEIKYINISDLNLWTENPRDPIDVIATDVEIINKAITDENHKWNLQKLSKEMGSFYDTSELPTVVEINSKFIVYDGNRRVAILKFLQNPESYLELAKKLKFPTDPIEFKNLTTIPCNVCDENTALRNIERKHTNSGTWDALERDYFLYHHRKEEKSAFLWFEEQTGGLISSNPKLNKGFVKDEVLTKDNLKKVGYSFDRATGFHTNYTPDQSNNILKKITETINDNEITTRKNRGQLLKPLIDSNPDLKDLIKSYDKNKPTYNLTPVPQEEEEKKKRKSQKSKPNDLIFGKPLILKRGRVNDLYLSICKIYNQNTLDDNILPIIGMSLRLILEISARIHYDEINDTSIVNDKFYEQFLKKAKKEMEVSTESENFLALTKGWLDKTLNLEALLGKFAHGNIITTQTDILQSSHVIADILEFYYKR